MNTNMNQDLAAQTSATTLASLSARACLRNTMLWNWNTIGACFIAEGWYIGSGSKFAITCLGVLVVAMTSEFICRLSREWERHVFARDVGNPQEYHDPNAGIELAPLQPAAAQPVPAQPVPAQPADAQSVQSAGARSAGAQSAEGQPAAAQAVAYPPARQDRVPPFLPGRVEHVFTRVIFHTLQHAIFFVLILVAMSFNGYVIICIIIGHSLGVLLFGRDPPGETNKTNAYQRVFQYRIACCDSEGSWDRIKEWAIIRWRRIINCLVSSW
ncbi:Ctr copper transporter family [Fusarium sp. NRRL 52700]|nr:Ctr copper transporter family [Fusarium sp. NRRL 52700]